LNMQEMIRLIQPLENKNDFEKLTEFLKNIFDDPDTFRFLTYTLVKFDKETIEAFTKSHKENGIDYLVYDKEGVFSGLLAINPHCSYPSITN